MIRGPRPQGGEVWSVAAGGRRAGGKEKAPGKEKQEDLRRRVPVLVATLGLTALPHSHKSPKSGDWMLAPPGCFLRDGDKSPRLRDGTQGLSPLCPLLSRGLVHTELLWSSISPSVKWGQKAVSQGCEDVTNGYATCHSQVV